MSIWAILLGVSVWRCAGAGSPASIEWNREHSVNTHQLIVWIPDRWIRNQFDQRVSKREKVACEILGTRITGMSQCTAQLVSMVAAGEGHAAVCCQLEGRIESKNSGVNGPAIIESTTSTSFQATKWVRFDGTQFTAGPLDLQVQLSMEITKVDTELRGIKGAIVRRVAASQAEGTREEARAIAEAKTKECLAHMMDQEFDRQITWSNSVVRLFRGLLEQLGDGEIRVVTRPKNEQVEVGLAMCVNRTNGVASAFHPFFHLLSLQAN